MWVQDLSPNAEDYKPMCAGPEISNPWVQDLCSNARDYRVQDLSPNAVKCKEYGLSSQLQPHHLIRQICCQDVGCLILIARTDKQTAADSYML